MRLATILLAICLPLLQPVLHAQTTDAAGKTLALRGVRATPLHAINLRTAASISASAREIAANTCLHVLEDRGSWLRVRVCRSHQEGFVYRPLVTTSEDVVVDRLLRDDPALQNAPLAPAVTLSIPTVTSPRIKVVADLWNRYGGLLDRLATELRIEPEVAVAVLAAESQGHAFVGNRPVVRFENHVFWDEWGSRNRTIFDRHFTFRRERGRHLDHQFRRAQDQGWRTFHDQGQPREWEVLEFATRLNRGDAYRSASWGLPQIMGFNHQQAGYASVESMVASFSNPRGGARMQILGFFDFVRGRLRNSPCLSALRNRDWVSFAQMYNGFGREQEYAKPLSDYYQTARTLLRR